MQMTTITAKPLGMQVPASSSRRLHDGDTRHPRLTAKKVDDVKPNAAATLEICVSGSHEAICRGGQKQVSSDNPIINNFCVLHMYNNTFAHPRIFLP